MTMTLAEIKSLADSKGWDLVMHEEDCEPVTFTVAISGHKFSRVSLDRLTAIVNHYR
jgi:hypothetical protein